MNSFRKDEVRMLVEYLEGHRERGVTMDDVQIQENRLGLKEGKLITALCFLQINGFVEMEETNPSQPRYKLLSNCSL